MQVYDVVIIGAGPSGMVATAYLNKMKINVLVLEKETFPRFVIGESLLPYCMDHLEEVDLLEAIKKIGFQKKTGASFYNDNRKCDFTFSEQHTKGWEWTWQVKRELFDKALADEVQKRGVDIRFNSTVKKVEFDAELQTIQYENEKGDLLTIKARFIIDASGYGRVLPQLLNLNQPSDFEPRGAIFTHVVDCNRTEKEGNNIFVHSFNNNEAWLWAIPFSDGHTSVGVVGNKELITAFSQNNGEKFKDFIQHFENLNGRFKNTSLAFEPRFILGYSIGVKKMYGKEFVLCGNSTEFLDPVFSSGVTLATYSGLLAAKLAYKQLSGDSVDWEKDYENEMKKGIDVFRSYVKAWYNGDLQTIFFSKEINSDIKNQICSVLAGYVWDVSNPFVKKHNTILATLAKVIRLKN